MHIPANYVYYTKINDSFILSTPSVQLQVSNLQMKFDEVSRELQSRQDFIKSLVDQMSNEVCSLFLSLIKYLLYLFY